MLVSDRASATGIRDMGLGSTSLSIISPNVAAFSRKEKKKLVQLLLIWCEFVSWHDGETARIVRMTTTRHYFMVDSGTTFGSVSTKHTTTD